MDGRARGFLGSALVAMVGVVGFGCTGGDSIGLSSDERGAAPPNLAETEERAIEESDIYRIEGDYLYVQNPNTGLNVVDISEPSDPVSVARADVTGVAGEIYVRDSRIFVVFEESEAGCGVPEWMDTGTAVGRSEVVALDGGPTRPEIVARYCLPGTVVASRIVGDILYVANREYAPQGWGTNQEGRSWILSFDISDPAEMRLADSISMTGHSREIHATNTAIYLAQQTVSDPMYYDQGTIVRYIDISDPEGAMVERGEIVVSGQPAGRFHMDEFEDHFRIVTYNETRSSNLHNINISDPDNLFVEGSIESFAQNEELHATHFVRDRAYVVTYEVVIRFTDPLWIISLDNPERPEILSELEVPGWSDYIFPMGDRLVAVGRGDEGDRVAVALFDISDPHNPVTLTRDEFGGDEAESEANLDFRGVTLVPQGVLGEEALLVVPYTEPYVSQYGCEDPGQLLQIWDLRYSELVRRGASEHQGTIRRSVVVDQYLYALSDEEVAAVDVSDRDRPTAIAALAIGDGSGVYSCDAFGGLGDGGCRVSASPPEAGEAAAGLLLMLGVFLTLGLSRRRAA